MSFSSLIQGSSLPIRRCPQCIRNGYGYLRTTPLQQRSSSIRRFTNSSTQFTTKKNPLRSPSSADHARTREAELARYRRQMGLSAAGIVACAVAMYGVIKLDVFGAGASTTDNNKPNLLSPGANSNKRGSMMQLDGPTGFPSGPSVIRIQGQDGIEQVPTGNSAVPFFPSTIQLPTSFDEAKAKASTLNLQPGQEVSMMDEGSDDVAASQNTEEYQLLGLGLRTVSFLGIEVYVVGLYVAKSDIAKLHQRLIQTAVNPPKPKGKQEDGTVSPIVGITSGTTTTSVAAATSLVPAEREALKTLLLDPTAGEEAWNAILKVDPDTADGIRTVFRIVPTRNTDFLHLRDGWVRGITARAQKAIATARTTAGPAPAKSEFEDEAFGSAMNEFKAVFGGGQRKSVPKGQTLMLLRNGAGALDALFQTEHGKPVRWLGRVEDERVGRLVWLNYLAGKTVSSESARRSVVDGMMAIVERPVGTVVQKVV